MIRKATIVSRLSKQFADAPYHLNRVSVFLGKRHSSQSSKRYDRDRLLAIISQRRKAFARGHSNKTRRRHCSPLNTSVRYATAHEKALWRIDWIFFMPDHARLARHFFISRQRYH